MKLKSTSGFNDLKRQSPVGRMITPPRVSVMLWRGETPERSPLWSSGLLQGFDNLLQDVGTAVCDLLQNGVGKLLQLSALSLTQLQLLLQLVEKKK